MWRGIKFCVLLLGLLSLVACDQNNDKIKQLNKEIENLKLSTTEIQKNIKDINKDLLPLRIDRDFGDIAAFTPESTGYQSINTESGVLYIRLKKIKEFAHGYYVTVQIGNPYTLIYSRIEINVSYGPSDKDKMLDFDKAKNFRTSTTVDIMPGYWTEVSFILSPATEKDIENIWVQLVPRVIKLREK